MTKKLKESFEESLDMKHGFSSPFVYRHTNEKTHTFYYITFVPKEKSDTSKRRLTIMNLPHANAAFDGERRLVFPSPIGVLLIAQGERGITRVTLARGGTEQEETPLLLEARRQIEAYFAWRLRAFDLPLEERGTAFECAVWAALRTVPYGQTRTYGQIAAQIGHERAARAVGMANHKNPIIIVTPCHRIVGANGSLTGYALGLEAKKALLRLEGVR